MKLWEIFDARAKLTWRQNGNAELAGFIYDDNPYIIQIYKTTLNQIPILSGKNTAEVSFFRAGLDDNIDGFSTTNDIKSNPSTLYGVVTNALLDKFGEYDAYYFSAERRNSATQKEYDIKVGIYNFAARRLCKSYGAWLYNHIDGARTSFIVSKIKFDDPKFKDVVGEAIENMLGNIDDWPRVKNH